MPTPTQVAVQEALQHPRRAFSVPELQGLVLEQRHGLPKKYDGACTFTTRGRLPGRGEVAVRCLLKPVPDLEARYAALARLRPTLPPALAASGASTCHPAALLVGGMKLTVVVMPWIQGRPLDQAVAAELRRPWILARLLRRFHELARELEGAGIAHGDLQHGNLLVDGQGRLHLIDLDSLRLPGGPGIPAGFLGHRNYQHPRLAGQRPGAGRDRFPALVIHLGLQALVLQPDLWRFNSGENLLLSGQDLLAPPSSACLRALAAVPGLGDQVRRFGELCLGDPEAVPDLAGVLGGEGIHGRGREGWRGEPLELCGQGWGEERERRELPGRGFLLLRGFASPRGVRRGRVRSIPVRFGPSQPGTHARCIHELALFVAEHLDAPPGGDSHLLDPELRKVHDLGRGLGRWRARLPELHEGRQLLLHLAPLGFQPLDLLEQGDRPGIEPIPSQFLGDLEKEGDGLPGPTRKDQEIRELEPGLDAGRSLLELQLEELDGARIFLSRDELADRDLAAELSAKPIENHDLS